MRRATTTLAAAAAALAVLAPAAQATFKGGNGRVAYGVQSKGIGDDGSAAAYRALATVQPDGRADRFLRECQQAAGRTVDGDCNIEYRSPAWRHDARQLVFDAGRQLALISSSGSGFSLLPAVTADDSQPAYSRSGRSLVFAGRSGSRTGLYVYDLIRRKAQRIVRRGADPDWSARNRIAFERGGGIYTVKPSGKGLKRVASGRDPGWSASGKSLILVRRGGIYTVGADGRKLKRVKRCSRCSSPVFSPNGKLFAYDAPGITVARLSSGRTVATLVRDFSAGGERFDGSDPSWGRR